MENSQIKEELIKIIVTPSFLEKFTANKALLMTDEKALELSLKQYLDNQRRIAFELLDNSHKMKEFENICCECVWKTLGGGIK